VETTCADFGTIDIFFNNAGIEGPTALLADYPVAEFRRVLEINVVGVFLGFQLVMPIMIRQGAGNRARPDGTRIELPTPFTA
jgi:NAD(P)-dependent dehydrogenase (short-subunit alcohol dehydrogenase family)